MNPDNKKNEFKKPDVDEDYLMNIISGHEPSQILDDKIKKETSKEPRQNLKSRSRSNPSAAVSYEELFLVNRYPSGRNGKVVYLRPEYHERLLRMVQLGKADRTTLYSYIDNILKYHFDQFGDDITEYFNKNFKPII